MRFPSGFYPGASLVSPFLVINDVKVEGGKRVSLGAHGPRLVLSGVFSRTLDDLDAVS